MTYPYIVVIGLGCLCIGYGLGLWDGYRMCKAAIKGLTR